MSHLESIQKLNVPRVPLNRDIFLRNFMRELAGALEEAAGIDDRRLYRYSGDFLK